MNGDPVEEGCVANGSVERSAYVFGASKQGQQVLERRWVCPLIGEQGIVKNTTIIRVDSSPETSQPVVTRCQYT